MRCHTLSVVLSTCFLVACAPPSQDDRDDDFLSGGKADNAISEGSPEARAILVVVNTATRDQLTKPGPAGVGLSQQTVDSVLAYRAGADAQLGTADDAKIATLAELDTVPFVGPIAFDALLAYTAPTALRIKSVSVMDPHIYARVASTCSDVTAQVNDKLAQQLVSDDNPHDGVLDLNVLSVFRPFRQDAVATAADIGGASCTASTPTTCRSGDAMAPTVATPRTTGACLDALPWTVSDYDPAIVTPSGPCFATGATTITLPVAGVELTLVDAKVAARYHDGGLADGLIRGFVSESQANAAILSANLPVIGGKPLASVLAGGNGSCSTGTDSDDGPGGERGWYFYVSFTATRVELDATP